MLNEINRGEVRTPSAPLDLFDLGKRERQARIGYLKSTIMTCELAGFGGVAEVDRNLVEWSYGDYEGLRTVEIHARHGDWQLFRDGCPGGESPGQVGARADEVVRRLRGIMATCRVFRAGIFCKCSLPAGSGSNPLPGRFLAPTASLSVLGYENNLSRPAIRFWNGMHHLEENQN